VLGGIGLTLKPISHLKSRESALSQPVNLKQEMSMPTLTEIKTKKYLAPHQITRASISLTRRR